MIGMLSRLLRPRLALLNGVAAAGGFLLFPAGVQGKALLTVFCGVALLAAAGSALNQVLEQDIDRMMARTRLRPLPQGQLTPAAATAIGAGLLLAGLLLLGAAGGLLPPLCGAFALLIYLGLYTPLKRRSACALLVGALCGALPPVIGWSVAGGSPADYRIVLLAGIFYLWQIPHFWLLQARHAADYRAAGVPLFAAAQQRSGFMTVWIVALSAAALLLPALGVTAPQHAAGYALLPLPLLALAFFRRERALFTCLNLFPLLVTLLLALARLHPAVSS